MSEVKVRFLNTSKKPIVFDPTAKGDFDNDPIHIVDQQGKPVSRIPLPTKVLPNGTMLVYFGMGRSNPIQLEPGKSTETSLGLNSTYGIRKPGIYKLTLERKFGKVSVKSNEIEFRVGVPLEPWEFERQEREFKEKR